MPQLSKKKPKSATTCQISILCALLVYHQQILSPTSLVYTALKLLYIAFCYSFIYIYMLYWISMFPCASFCIMAAAFCIKRQWIFLNMWHKFSDIKHNSVFVFQLHVLYTWLPELQQILSFKLSITFALNYKAQKISSWFSYTPHFLTSTQKNIKNYKIFCENILYISSLWRQRPRWHQEQQHLRLSWKAGDRIHQYVKKFSLWKRMLLTKLWKINKEKF